MGDIWLHDWPEALRDYGVEPQFWPGWEFASRSSGGLDRVMGIGRHHDAWPAGVPWERRARYAWDQHKYRPVGNAIIGEAGEFIIGAAGASNTQGRQLDSDPAIVTSKGRIPHSSGNRYMISIETCGDGIGQQMTEAAAITTERVEAATCDLFDLVPETDCVSHWRYTKRKVDTRMIVPSRPSWGGVVWHDFNTRWNDAAVSADVRRVMNEHNAAGGDDMKMFDRPIRVLDTRWKKGEPHPVPGWNPIAWDFHPVNAGQTIDVWLGVPKHATQVAVNLTVTNPEAPGFLTAWSTGDEVPTSSVLNYSAGQTIANGLVLPCRDNRMKLFARSRTDVVVDVAGWA